MLRSFLRYSPFALPLLMISGCGGGSSHSGGGGVTPTTVTVTFAGPAPTAVATKIGSGQFSAGAVSSGKVTLSLPSGTTSFAVAYVCPAITSVYYPSQTYQFVMGATTADGTTFTQSCAASASQTGPLTINMDITALSDESGVFVQAVSGGDEPWATSTDCSNGFDGAVQAPLGSDTVEILSYSGDFQDQVLAGVKVFNNQPVPGTVDGGNVVYLGTPDETTEQPITISNDLEGESTIASNASYYLTGKGIPIALGNRPSEYSVVPADVAQTSGIYVVEAQESQDAAAPTIGTSAVSTTISTNTPGPLAIILPNVWTFSAPSPAAAPTFAMNYTGFAGKSSVHQSAEIGWDLTDDSLATYSMDVTENYLNGATSLALPDLSSISGFLPLPASGTSISWSATVSEGNIGNSMQGYLPDASTMAVSSSGNYRVP